MKDRVEGIRTALEEKFTPSFLSVEDESWKHAGHAGPREQGGGHFCITIASTQFIGQSRMERHRMIHRTLSSLFGPTIHAITIRAITPDETP